MNQIRQLNTNVICNNIILIYLQHLIEAGILDIWYHNVIIYILWSAENLNWTLKKPKKLFIFIKVHEQLKQTKILASHKNRVTVTFIILTYPFCIGVIVEISALGVHTNAVTQL